MRLLEFLVIEKLISMAHFAIIKGKEPFDPKGFCTVAFDEPDTFEIEFAGKLFVFNVLRIDRNIFVWEEGSTLNHFKFLYNDITSVVFARNL